MESLEKLEINYDLMIKVDEVKNKIKSFKKNKRNTHFNNTYASLDAILSMISKPMKDVGLTLAQIPTIREGIVSIRTIIVDLKDKVHMEFETCLPTPKLDPQGWSSAVSYGKRVALIGFFSLPVEEDDDGNSSSVIHKPHATEIPAPRGLTKI